MLTTLVGAYAGYFGAAAGVLVLAVLGLATDLPFRVANALKTLAVLSANVTAAVVFLLVATLDWRAVALLALGSVVGGYAGARLGRSLPPALLRALVVVAGLAAFVLLL